MNYRRLVARCQKGDRKAQRQLYDLFKQRLMGICVRYARERAEAEDIFHEALVKVFEKIGSLNNPQALPGWIRQIVINTAVNQYRANLKLLHHDETVLLQESSEE